MKAKVGISLSGGGARGIAHIGVLAALEKYGIYPGIVAGTSVGAIVGVLYAFGHSPAKIREIMKVPKLHKLLSLGVPSNGLLDLDKVETLLREHIPEDDFSALKREFYCAVTNLNSGQVEIISSGKLISYVIASSSIPVIFEPVTIDGQTYVDGGLLNNLPVEPLLSRADIVIGVHVNHIEEMKEISGLKTIAERSFRLAIGKNIGQKFDLCDFVIDPPQIRKFSTFDFNRADEIYQVGFNETENQILDFFDQLDLEAVIKEKKKRLELK